MSERPSFLARFFLGMPAALFWTVAAGSVLMLIANDRRNEAVTETTVAAVDNFTQARLRVAQARLAWERLHAGDPTFEPSRPLSELDRALQLLDDVRAGRSSILDVDAAPLEDQRLDSLSRAYGAAIVDLRDALEDGTLGADPVSLRRRFAAMEDRADAVEREMYDVLRERQEREELRHGVELGVWLAFLAVAGGSFTLARRGHRRADERRSQAELQRSQAQEAREIAERRYAALATHAAAGIVRTDGDGGVLEATYWWQDTLGVGVEDWAGEAWWAVLEEVDRERAAELWTTKAGLGEPFFLEVHFRDESGERRWLASRWAPVGGGGPDAGSWVGTFIDETEHQTVEEQLRQAQKLEAVGRLTSGIAHDFNNLLGVILANVHLLREREDVDEETRELLGDVETAARGGSDLVKGLLGFTRRSDLNVSRVDLGEVVRETGRLARRLLPDGVRMELDVPDDGPVVYADARVVQQILLNLVSNARDAVGDEGRVAIEVDRAEIEEGYGDARSRVEPGRFGRLMVVDDGTGMDPETLERIFDPFFTTKPEGEGTGLGLAMVHGLVQQHGGHIHAYSEPGAGTAFRVYLPLAAGEEAAVDPTASTDVAAVEGAHAPPGRLGRESLRILVVDDEEILRRTARRILVRLGHRVVEASNGREALDLIRSDEPVDLVISDISMREMDGLELFRRLREAGDRRPFVFTSGYTAREMAAREGVPDDAVYLPKPWTIAELEDALRNAS